MSLHQTVQSEVGSEHGRLCILCLFEFELSLLLLIIREIIPEDK